MASVLPASLPAPEPNGQGDGIWPVTARRNARGELEIGGVPVSELVATYGTPTFILDEADMRQRARAWQEAMRDAFADGPQPQVYYAGKAFLCGAVAQIVAQEGLNIDSASYGELVTALASGVPGARIGLHGNAKTDAEIELALKAGIAHIVIDSLGEIEQVARIAQARGQVAPVYIRVTTGIHAGGHTFIATAHEDQKFGLSLASGAAQEAIERISRCAHVRLIGLHSHIGSQITGVDGFIEAAKKILELRAWAAERGWLIPEIDLGGGYAVRYWEPDEAPCPRTDFARALAQVVAQHCAHTGLTAPKIAIEPGRSIVGPAMVTLYRVLAVKDVQTDEGVRRYVSVDGGMSDNIRPALYGANYTATLAQRISSAQLVQARVVGKHCESGDIVVHNVALPEDVRIGDVLAVPVTGAYGRSMASNYNMIARPGVVSVYDGQSREIVRRESVADLLALDCAVADAPAGLELLSANELLTVLTGCDGRDTAEKAKGESQ
ncbi:diaminopimelate decarboxylase [Trueperella sp. LYQ143]|uniref:diaminopimelate decarboxylase n=1 Tax=unclassified Trueperella TaxID=2630174 RepID=UPI0039830097